MSILANDHSGCYWLHDDGSRQELTMEEWKGALANILKAPNRPMNAHEEQKKERQETTSIDELLGEEGENETSLDELLEEAGLL